MTAHALTRQVRTGGQTDGSRTYIANRGSSHIECITAIHPNSDAAREDQYIEITDKIRETPLMVDVPVYEMRENPDTGEQERVQVGTREVVNGERERLMIIQDRCMKQCRQGASDFGMTVSSRCRLVVPKAKETKPENKFAKYASS